ncbi:RsbR, positive regulator of sigma-B [Bacillus sp. JCM 19046]|nr:RsbR, positive regulator of sigma-B [Bacillus sp. JCM 19045]GAF18053.1 RsbR, positive regulator of sigma-B [Bacillus sp. JCM 19046]
MFESFYHYFKNHTWELTEQWFKTLSDSKSGVYALQGEEQINKLKKQNHAFHEIFSELFDNNIDCIESEFKEWIEHVASDQAHLDTPLTEIVEEFLRNQAIYIDFIEQFATKHQLSFSKYNDYIRMIHSAYDTLIITFIERNQEKSEQILHAQRELISDLSSPIINLNKQIALLPLIGNIDTERAKIIFQKTLETCSMEEIDCLLIDLSGVPIVDTMVANELFELVKGLRLLGTQASLSGIRPELAQTAVQLGVDFSHIRIFSNIAKALAELEFNTIH